MFTAIYAKQDPQSKLRNYLNDVCLTLDTKAKMLLNYKLMAYCEKLEIPIMDYSNKEVTVEIMSDLIDTHIIIGTLNFLSLFTSTFEMIAVKMPYISVEFIQYMLTNEIVNYKMYYHIEDTKFFAALENY